MSIPRPTTITAPTTPPGAPHEPDHPSDPGIAMPDSHPMWLLIAQATGAFVVTDSEERWRELRGAGVLLGEPEKDSEFSSGVPGVGPQIKWIVNLEDAHLMLMSGRLGRYREFVARFVSEPRGSNRKWDIRRVKEEERRARRAAQREIEVGTGDETAKVRFDFWAPRRGISHNHVQRLMVRCGLEARPLSVPMAVFVDTAEIYCTGRFGEPMTDLRSDGWVQVPYGESNRLIY